MKIIKLEAENIKRLTAIDITPNKNIVEITGKNEAGKSTVLDSIIYALCGKSEIDVEPLKQGENRGEIRLDLGKYIVTRTFLESGNTNIKVELSEEEAEVKKPQSALDKLYVDITFDPFKFINADKKEQREMLLKLINLKVDQDYLCKFSQFQSTESDPLKNIKRHLDFSMIVRKEKKKEYEAIKAQADAIVIPEDKLDIKHVSVKDLTDKKDQMYKDQKAIDNMREKKNICKERLGLYDKERAKNSEAIKEFKNEILEQEAKNTEAIENLKAEILKQEEKNAKAIQKIKDKISTSEEEGSEIERKIVSTANELHELGKIVDKTKDIDFTEIDEQIKNVEENNKIADMIHKTRVLAEQIETTKARVKKSEENVQAIRDYKESLLANVNMPLEGLGFDEEGNVTLDNIPLSQRGTSQKIIIGLKIGAAMNPKLRVALIKHGNDIDDDNMAKMAEWAAENDYQIWVERVASSKKGDAIYIEEGVIKND